MMANAFTYISSIPCTRMNIEQSLDIFSFFSTETQRNSNGIIQDAPSVIPLSQLGPFWFFPSWRQETLQCSRKHYHDPRRSRRASVPFTSQRKRTQSRTRPAMAPSRSGRPTASRHQILLRHEGVPRLPSLQQAQSRSEDMG